MTVDAGSLLGRGEDLCVLARLLECERMVTLTGAPGIGKTRLARELASGYGCSARVVELAQVMEGELVPRALASALSIPEASGQGVTDTLLARLRARRMLIVLDNCEHLLGACAQLVDALLSGCPDVRVVATSREPLGLGAETVWRVAPLPVPDPAETSPEVLSGYAAVRLFVERAAAVEPDFALNAYVAPAVAEVCRRLDGIPLAIELAAARVASLTPEEIARRLEDRFGLLTRGSPDGLGRHQTLQAALDWSYELLSAAERTLLRRLSVFVGGFDLEAAEGVCADEEVQSGEICELLVRLVSKSLVATDISRSGRARYRLLETVCAYAVERLDQAGEAAAARRSHARFYLALAERAEPELTGPRQHNWFERLEAERANLRSAVEWSLSLGQEAWALRLAGALVLFWRVRGHFGEGRELLEATLSADDGAPMKAWAKALWGAGFMALMNGDVEGAVPSLEQSLSGFREVGDQQGCARALLVLGNSRQYQVNEEDALSLLEESMAEAREAGDSWCLAHALAIAGFDYLSRDELSAAGPLFEECLQVAREAEDKQGLRVGLMGLGSVAQREGDVRLAESLLEETLTVTCELGEDYGRARTLLDLGQLAVGRGDYRRARQVLDEAVVLTREIGSSLSLPVLLALRGKVAHAEGDRHRARQLFEEAMSLARAGSLTRITALGWMGWLAAEEGDVGGARRQFEEALELARSRGDRAAMAEGLRGLGRLARDAGETKRAVVLHYEALQLEREIGRACGMIVSLEALAGLAADAGRYAQAARLLGTAKAHSEENGYSHAPWAVPRYEADLALVCDALAPAEFEAAFAAGAQLSLEQAAAQAVKRRGTLARPASGWSSLTDSEHHVTALVADGLTNPEIAESLFISLATVKAHLSRIFQKLGIADRRELAREARRRANGPD